MIKFIFSICFYSLIYSHAALAAPTKIRIGWQIPWATQGQIVQIWKHTDILKKNNLEGEFIGRTFGPELNELAMSNSIDVILTADQPAATLFAKDKGWVGIARLMYNRTSTYVPPKSPIKNLKGLKGKTIGMPVGAAAERVALEALNKDGLTAKDLNILNLDIKEQGPLVRGSQGKETWGNFDALSGFDPIPAILEAEGLVKVLHVGKVVSLVLINQDFVKANAKITQQIQQALIDAYDYYRQHQSEANKWFIAEAHLQDEQEKACQIAASLEPNLKVTEKKDIRISFNEDDFKILQSAADFVEKKVGKRVDMKKFVIQ